MPKNLASSGAWVALDNMSAALLAFLFFVVTARLLTPEQFGVAALVLSVAQIIQPMIESLFHDAVVQKETLDAEDLTAASTLCILWSVVLAGALWLLSPAIAYVLSAPSVATYLPWMGLSFIFAGLSAVASAEARRNMQFRWLAIRTIIGRTVGMAIGFWMAWQGFGIWSIVAQALISAGVASLLLLAKTGIHVGRMSWSRLRPLLSFAAPTVGTQVLLFANSRLMTLMVGGVLGTVAAGTWSVAFRFVEPLQAVLATTIGQLALPVFSRQQADRDVMSRYFSLGTKYLSLLLAPSFLGLAVCAEHVITVFVGTKWLGAVPIMQIVCVVTMLLLVRQLAEITLTSRGRPSYTFYTHVIGSALSFAGVYCGVFFGLIAAAIGWSTRVIPFLTINVIFVRRELGLAARDQFSHAALPTGAGLVMCLVLHVLDLQLRAHHTPLFSLVAMIATGAVVYLAIVACFDGESRKLAVAYLHKITARRT